MKQLLGLCILTFVLCLVHADIETCTDVADCSESIKNNCIDMPAAGKESGSSQKFVVACKNGICMCNVEFTTNARHTSHAEDNKEAKDETENDEES